jgi:hypothetical protein
VGSFSAFAQQTDHQDACTDAENSFTARGRPISPRARRAQQWIQPDAE